MSGGRRILALVGDAWGGRGGIAQYNRDLLGALAGSDAARGIEVLPRHAPDAAAPPQGIVQRPARAGRIAYALGALAAALNGRVDVVFCGHLYMAPLAWLIARLKRARLVVQTHGVEAWPRPTPLRRAAVEAADLVLSVSRHTRARVLDWAAIDPERARVIPNTVGEDFAPGDGAGLRRAWGLEHRRVLLTVGRMASAERYKGHERVIAALPGLARAGLDVVYVIVGEGDDRPRLEALATDAGLGERVRFVGAVGRERLVQAYRMADLFVMPSAGEGFGIAFLEAMACGTPAVGLAAAGAVDPLGDGELGTAVAAEVLEVALARRLAGGRPDPQRLAAAVRSRFGGQAFADHAERVLAELTA
jgi:phosphatidylinositol alpha-1,6-mannosyltransferase